MMAEKTVKKLDGLTMKQKRSIAKVGMTVSLAVLVVTGLNRTRNSRKIHLAAGISMIGFSAYHAALYPKGYKD